MPPLLPAPCFAEIEPAMPAPNRTESRADIRIARSERFPRIRVQVYLAGAAARRDGRHVRARMYADTAEGGIRIICKRRRQKRINR